MQRKIRYLFFLREKPNIATLRVILILARLIGPNELTLKGFPILLRGVMVVMLYNIGDIC